MFPWLAVKPASGRISSLGIGGNTFSMAMISPAPGPPSASITEITQAVKPVGSAVVDANGNNGMCGSGVGVSVCPLYL
ncbi:hypothetical protein GCM10023222_13160 [Saccharopolyspora cebuensis]